jgi:hypothetical protein
MADKVQHISLNFPERTNPESDEFSIFTFSGNHWDDIFYFPKNYQIGLVQNEQGTFTAGQQEYVVKQGDTYFLKPELGHTFFYKLKLCVTLIRHTVAFLHLKTQRRKHFGFNFLLVIFINLNGL